MIPDDSTGHDTDPGSDRVAVTDMVTDDPANHAAGDGGQTGRVVIMINAVPIRLYDNHLVAMTIIMLMAMTKAYRFITAMVFPVMVLLVAVMLAPATIVMAAPVMVTIPAIIVRGVITLVITVPLVVMTFPGAGRHADQQTAGNQ
jgi:hypothetical protein